MTVFGSGMAHANAPEGIVVSVRMRQGRLALAPHRQEHLPLFGERVGTKPAATLLYKNGVSYTVCGLVKHSYNNELRCYTETRFRILTGIHVGGPSAMRDNPSRLLARFSGMGPAGNASRPPGRRTVFERGMPHVNALVGAVVSARTDLYNLQRLCSVKCACIQIGLGVRLAAILLYENDISYTMRGLVKHSYNNELLRYTETRFRILTGIYGWVIQVQCGAIPRAPEVG